ncbi:S8 family serine peptidase [bacterium]|nr:S8 family serine peptidase [bacterium]
MLTRLRAVLTVAIVVLVAAASTYAEFDYTLKLRTGEFTPQQSRLSKSAAAALEDKHVFIQFDQPLTDSERDRLASRGIVLLDYVPNMAYTARLESAPDQSTLDEFGIRWLDQIKPNQKVSPVITDYGIFDWARRGGDRVQFVVVIHRDEDARAWADRLEQDYDAEIIGIEPTTNSIDLILPEQAYLRLPELDGIVWIEQGYPYPEEHNNGARANTGADVLQASPWNLTGSGVVVSEWDGGSVYDTHPDLIGRVQKMDFSSDSEHATHVAGTIVGDGTASGGLYAGMAPQASLKSYLWWNSGSEAQTEYSYVISNYNARIASNSWGYGVGDPATQAACEATMGNYFTVCATIDNIVRGSSGAPIAIGWSAGNQRGTSSKYCGSIGWSYNTVTPLPTSKNVIAVGSINSNNDVISSFSSFGPTDDGRVKPDVVGPGCESGGGITSTFPNGGYYSMCGTSMSCPAVTGTMALIFERWDQAVGTGTPLSSTIKGILINTAQDLGAVGPDYAYGHGKVDGVAAVEKIGFGEGSYVESDISTGTSHLYDLTIPGGTPKLKVTVVWDDPGGTVSSSQNLINDIDLVLIDPFNGEEYPWVLDPQNPSAPATRSDDHLNNVETVEVDNPTPGLWKARVSGFNIPNGPQSYSIIFSPDDINTPGNLAALAVFDQGTIVEQPGQPVTVDFYVTNIGANPDSVTVSIDGLNGWLSGSIIDSVVTLAPWDSALFSLTANVPPASLAGEYDLVSCTAVSLTSAQVTAQRETRVEAGAYYGVDLTPPPIDTTASPDTVLFTLSVLNTGNDTDYVTVIPTNDSGWTIIPEIRQTPLNPAASTNLSFSVIIPAEVTDGAETPIDFEVTSDGGVFEQDSFILYTSNPNQPPALVLPDDRTYTQNGRVDFEWAGPADSFTLYVAEDSLMNTIVREYPGLTQTSFTVPSVDSLGDGGYYWAVRLFTGADSSSLQRHSRLVVVDNIPPNDLIPVTPANNSYTKQQYVHFGFQIAPDKDPDDTSPEVRLIQVASDSGFSQDLMTLGPISGQGYDLTAPQPTGRWYWRAFAIDSAGNVSDTSQFSTFLIDTETPPVPTPLRPADGGSVSGDTLAFAWTLSPDPSYETAPEYFYVHISVLPNFADFSTFNQYVYSDSLVLPSSVLTLGETYYWRVKAHDSAGWYSDYSVAKSFTYQNYVCGDVNQSNQAPDLSDLIYLVNYLFLGGPAPTNPSAADVNCDGGVDLSDVITLVNYLFLGSGELCCL